MHVRRVVIWKNLVLRKWGKMDRAQTYCKASIYVWRQYKEAEIIQVGFASAMSFLEWSMLAALNGEVNAKTYRKWNYIKWFFNHKFTWDFLSFRIRTLIILMFFFDRASQYRIISFTNFNAQLLYSLTICMLHYYPRHFSSINMPIFRRTNFIHTGSGIIALCKRLHRLRADSAEYIYIYI